jgi:hypothetical protein
MYFDHIEFTMRHCILQRLCPIFWFECEDITMIRSRLFNKQTHVLWKRGSRKREITKENLQLPWSLSVASVSIWCALGRHAVYYKSCWWVNRNCGCTQTRSSNLLLVELPLLQVVVELLQLLWSRKELDLGHSNWLATLMMKKTLLIRKNPWQFLTPHNPRTSQVDPNVIPCGASEVDPNAISLPPLPLNISWWNNWTSSVRLQRRPKTLQNPSTLDRWSTSNTKRLEHQLYNTQLVCCWESLQQRWREGN